VVGEGKFKIRMSECSKRWETGGMVVIGFDSRSPERCDRDEAIAAEPALTPLDPPPDALAQPTLVTG
jgi:hypothetical protein